MFKAYIMTTEIKLPELNDFKSIPQSMIDEFRKDGHTLVRGLLSQEEVKAYQEVLVHAAEKYNTEKRKM